MSCDTGADAKSGFHRIAWSKSRVPGATNMLKATFAALEDLRGAEEVARARGLHPDNVQPYQSYSDVSG